GTDRCTCRTLSSYRQVVLGCEQLTSRVEHVGQCNDTCGIGLLGQIAHPLQFSDLAENFISAVLRLDEQAECVLDIFGRVKGCALILDQGFGIGAPRSLHFRGDRAEIEESPAKTYDTDRLKSLLLEEMGRSQRLRAHDPRKGELWIVFGESLANASV